MKDKKELGTDQRRPRIFWLDFGILGGAGGPTRGLGANSAGTAAGSGAALAGRRCGPRQAFLWLCPKNHMGKQVRYRGCSLCSHSFSEGLRFYK